MAKSRASFFKFESKYSNKSPYDYKEFQEVSLKPIFEGGYCPYCYDSMRILKVSRKGIVLECISCYKNIELSDVKIIKKTQCPYPDCIEFFNDSKNLNYHISDKHIKSNSKISTSVPKINNLITCEYCGVPVNKKNYEKHLKKCPKLSSKRINELLTESKTLSVNKFKCRYCSHILSSYEELNRHESKHSVNDKNKFLTKEKDNIKKLEKYFSKEEIFEIKNKVEKKINNIGDKESNMTNKKNLIYNEADKLNLKNKSFMKPKNISFHNDINKKKYNYDSLNNISSYQIKEKKTLKLKEQIPKHQAKTTQYDEKLNPDIITDEELYQKEFIQKVQEDIKEFEEAKQNEIVEEIVVVRKKSNTKKSKEQRQKIKDYLFDTYKGYCQICGFTFRKVEDGKNSFEMFNWNDKRVVKKKKSFITTADSLCLCRNCSANIKWGAFEPIFMDKINAIENFSNKSLDEIKEVICVELEDNIVKKFKDDYEWEDIYALEITVNDEPKNIYMTNGHLIQFIAYLQLEER